MLNKVKFSICGKDLTLQTSESSNYVFGLARTLESRITEITNTNSSASPFTAAIMVGMSTLDDLNKTNRKLDSLREQSKEYVDEAGKTRLAYDAAIKEVNNLKSEIAELKKQLENATEKEMA
ncbi:MAG: cell division protein ZapA [Ruminococcus sp.]|nr:cell division protein ZapA [Ruminococcus sp.]